MDRTTATNAVVSLVGLVAQGTAELHAKDEEIAQLRAALAQEKDALRRCIRDLTQAGECLHAEEERRAKFQDVHAAAMRFTHRFMQENPRKGWAAGWRCPAVEMKALLVATGEEPTADNG